MRQRKIDTWVVYRTAATAKLPAMNAVCETGEWTAMELAQPGQRTLIQGGIDNEAEAEKLARGTSGDPVPRAFRKTVAVKTEVDPASP